MKQITIKLLALGLICFGLYACTDDYFDFDKLNTDEWRPELAIPIASSVLDLEDILIKRDTGEVITVDPNTGVLEIVYDGSVFATLEGDFVDLPSQSFNERISNVVIPNGSPPIRIDSLYRFTFNSTVEVDSVLLKSGILELDFESTFQHDIDIIFEFPGIKDPFGQPLLVFQSLPASNGSSPSRANTSRSLIDYTVDMTEGGRVINSIPVNVNIIISPIAGNPSSVSDELRFNFNLRSLDFRRFGGYIGERSVDLRVDTINVNLFKNFKAGVFFITNPTLNIDIKNSFGIPTNLEFEELKALNPDQQSSPVIDVDLPVDPVTNEKNLRRLNSPQNYGIANTDIDLNNTNSNIANIISFLLKQIVYQSRTDFNPDGKVQRNFISDTSGIGIDVFLKIPFEGRVERFFLVDTIDLDFEIAEDIEKGTVRVIADNSFPVDAKLQLYFLDSLYNPIDSLFYYDNELPSSIPAANVDVNGDAIGSNRSITEAIVNRERLDRLDDGRFAVISAELNTTNSTQGQIVRFKPNHRLDIAIGLKAAILID